MRDFNFDLYAIVLGIIVFTGVVTNAVTVQVREKNTLVVECLEKYKTSAHHPADIKMICGTIN